MRPESRRAVSPVRLDEVFFIGTLAAGRAFFPFYPDRERCCLKTRTKASRTKGRRSVDTRRVRREASGAGGWQSRWRIGRSVGGVVEKDPVTAQFGNRLGETLEIDRLDHIAVDAKLVA